MDDHASQIENRSLSSCVPFWDILGSFPFLSLVGLASGAQFAHPFRPAAASGFRNSMTLASGWSARYHQSEDMEELCKVLYTYVKPVEEIPSYKEHLPYPLPIYSFVGN